MTTWRSIDGNNAPPEGQPVLVRCPQQDDRQEAYAVVRRKGLWLLLDLTGEKLTRRADLWTEAPVVPQWGYQGQALEGPPAPL